MHYIRIDEKTFSRVQPIDCVINRYFDLARKHRSKLQFRVPVPTDLMLRIRSKTIDVHLHRKAWCSMSNSLSEFGSIRIIIHARPLFDIIVIVFGYIVIEFSLFRCYNYT